MSTENTSENKTSINSLLDGNQCSNAPKVRKAYTITKHREKWSEEEHQKFLEAIKLYGRGWRQIEEHIGTKTAIQIGSHAQKFFSKVSREGSDAIKKPIEIPPPRPKRKSLHPYPHKDASESPRKLVSVSYETETSPPPNLNTIDTQNGCSTSPLSTLDSPRSATSCATNDMDSNSLLALEDSSPTRNLDSKDTACTETSSNAQFITIKLFGKTVVVQNKDDSNSMVATSDTCSPWLSSFSILPFPQVPMCNGALMGLHRDERTGEEEADKLSRLVQGFVPYKRCSAQQDINPSVPMDEGEDQRIQVCL